LAFWVFITPLRRANFEHIQPIRKAAAEPSLDSAIRKKRTIVGDHGKKEPRFPAPTCSPVRVLFSLNGHLADFHHFFADESGSLYFQPTGRDTSDESSNRLLS
jgi:hypothetical protein